jgi:hypothetical protein
MILSVSSSPSPSQTAGGFDPETESWRDRIIRGSVRVSPVPIRAIREGMSFVNGAPSNTRDAVADRTETVSPLRTCWSAKPAGGLSGDARNPRLKFRVPRVRLLDNPPSSHSGSACGRDVGPATGMREPEARHPPRVLRFYPISRGPHWPGQALADPSDPSETSDTPSPASRPFVATK